MSGSYSVCIYSVSCTLRPPCNLHSAFGAPYKHLVTGFLWPGMVLFKTSIDHLIPNLNHTSRTYLHVCVRFWSSRGYTVTPVHTSCFVWGCFFKVVFENFFFFLTKTCFYLVDCTEIIKKNKMIKHKYVIQNLGMLLRKGERKQQ